MDVPVAPNPARPPGPAPWGESNPGRRRGSLGVKLLAVALACLVANGVFVAIYFPSRYEADSMRALRSKAVSLAQVIAASIAPALDFDDAEGTRVALSGLERVPEVAYGRVTAPDGALIAEVSRPGGANAVWPRRAGVAAGAGSANGAGGAAGANGASTGAALAAAPEIVTQEIISPLGTRLGRLEIGYSAAAVHADASRYRHTILLITLLLVAASGMAVTVVSRRIARPLRRLSDAARRISGGEYDLRLDAPTNDEAGELTASFALMTTRLVESRRLVEQYTEGLEALVTKRTEELSRKNEELLIQSQRAEESNRLKSEFLANMSHELRTPLSSIIGFLALILEGICDDEAERMELLRDAHQSSLHLLSLINYVLDLAKIEAGRLEVVRERIDLGAEFAEVEKLLSIQAKTRFLALKFETDPGLPDAIADRERIRQILINLVGNSIKFTPSGSITVRARRNDGASELLVEVTDTGIGIAKEKQASLFQKFTQVDGSRTRHYGGTGLGLALSRSLVELMDGEIGLESDGEGHGTRVWFTLPLASTDPAGAGTVYPTDDPTAPLVLVVEDDPVFARFLVRVLRSGQYRALVARTADEAFRLAQETRPLAMTVDLGLPFGPESDLHSGIDLIDRVGHTGWDTRILVITGAANVTVEQLPHTDPTQAPYTVLRKPADPNEILSALARIPRPNAGGKRTVLVADDAPAMATIVERIMRNDSLRVLKARDGVEAMHTIRTADPPVDLLLLDLEMPELDGFGVLREIAEVEPSRRPEVLVLTNYPELASGPESALLRQSHVWGVLPKARLGDDPELLKRALARIARKERFEYAAHPSR